MEYSRIINNAQTSNIIFDYKNEIIQIILAGLCKIDENNTDEGIEDLSDTNCAMNAGYALE